ncbi:MAG: flagellar hook-length control protein FliK [bacterium]|jgi:hypothetical protein|nr:flagellar hook-length control protein FliK [bacterium]
MLDPLISQRGRLIAQQALAAGLDTLLKSGPQTGTVLSNPGGGKTVIVFAGKPFPLDLKGPPLEPGQQVLARLIDGKLVLELLPPKSGASLPGSSEGGRTLAGILAGMGVQGANAPFIAQAFLQAGMPLDPAVLQEFSSLLPNLTQDQILSLSFLLSRGLPIQPQLVFFLFQLFSKQSLPTPSPSRLIKDLKKAESQLDDEPIEGAVKRKLKELRQRLEEKIMPLRDEGGEAFEDELHRRFSENLTAPEAQLANGEESDSMGGAIVELLSLLYQIQAHMAISRFTELFGAIFHEANRLYEHLLFQNLRNLPVQNADVPVVYFQLPFREDQHERSLDVLYREKRKNKKGGTLDLRLELTNLGPMRISIQWDHPHLSLTLLVTEPQVALFLEPLMQQLKESLQQKGFAVSAVRVAVGAVPDSLREEVEEGGIILPRGGVDFRA